MILLIDHYDSFTYNLAQYLQELGEQVEVVRYDALTIEAIHQMNPKVIVLSPGPGHPRDYTVTQDIFKKLHTTYPFLGICLGHQLMGLCTGAEIISAPQIFHGKTSQLVDAVTNEDVGVVMRYHSLAVDSGTLSEEFVTVSFAQEDGTLMEMRHRTLPIVGMQYHPESIGTPDGRERLANYLQGVMRSESYL
ncbi:aminodeoxychorismate/anthranilate synthase component II [Chryseomicrobium sp. FSL W7-1435]|uniref:anthranilate synthase component II n=1 Tax=Chryseomicrobium sp. FSL W7-1435 TaxID=2921704 RepID=UPI00315B297E